MSLRSRPSGLASHFKRFLSSSEELEAQELEALARNCGARPVSECEQRTKVRLRGTVSSVLDAGSNGRTEAELADGTGCVRLVWMGRRKLACIMPGVSLIVSGRLTSDEGKPVIYNPAFEVVA